MNIFRREITDPVKKERQKERGKNLRNLTAVKKQSEQKKASYYVDLVLTKMNIVSLRSYKVPKYM